MLPEGTHDIPLRSAFTSSPSSRSPVLRGQPRVLWDISTQTLKLLAPRGHSHCLNSQTISFTKRLDVEDKNQDGSSHRFKNGGRQHEKLYSTVFPLSFASHQKKSHHGDFLGGPGVKNVTASAGAKALVQPLVTGDATCVGGRKLSHNPLSLQAVMTECTRPGHNTTGEIPRAVNEDPAQPKMNQYLNKT